MNRSTRARQRPQSDSLVERNNTKIQYFDEGTLRASFNVLQRSMPLIDHRYACGPVVRPTHQTQRSTAQRRCATRALCPRETGSNSAINLSLWSQLRAAGETTSLAQLQGLRFTAASSSPSEPAIARCGVSFNETLSPRITSWPGSVIAAQTAKTKEFGQRELTLAPASNRWQTS